MKRGPERNGAPYKELYIYYIKGNADTRDAGFDERFIGNWEERDGFSFLFFSKEADSEVQGFLEHRPELALLDRFVMPYDQWQPLDDFPLQAGRFAVYPYWMEPGRKKIGRTITIDPGVVFGSGCHATTSDCLAALDFIMEPGAEKYGSALDIGSGTGLLSIAAALSGIERVIGIDINPLAATTATRNARLNNVEGKALFVVGDALELPCIKTDLFIANIHYDVTRRLLFSRAFLSCRSFILSGLMRSQALKIVDLLKKMPVTLTKEWNSDGIWYTFTGERH